MAKTKEDIDDESVELTIPELAQQLTGKQRLFCKEYVMDLNATQSAIRAGYSPKSAAESGCENLRKSNIIAYIEALRSDLSYATGITEHKVLMRHKQFAFTDLSSLYTEWGSLKPLSQLSDDQKAIINSIEVKDGEVKIKGQDAKSSLSEISKILGHYAPTKSEVKADVSVSDWVGLDEYL